MLTSFVADNSWVNQISQMLLGNDSVKHYQFVELFTHKKLLIIDLVELEFDEETDETFEHHRKLITSDTKTALKLIHDNQAVGIKLSSLGLIKFGNGKEINYTASTVNKITLSTDLKGFSSFEYHLDDSCKINEVATAVRIDANRKNVNIFENNELSSEYRRIFIH